MIHIVAGLGYGDEGKGKIVQQLCRDAYDNGRVPRVIRHSGGHQCGHRVVDKEKGTSHIFSNFGSGTLLGAATFWSKNCTVEPFGFVEEHKVLVEMGLSPSIMIDPRCPVTTLWDVKNNRYQELHSKHGSTGLGFGATIERDSGPHTLRVIDFFNKDIAVHKIKTFFGSNPIKEEEIEQVIEKMEYLLNVAWVKNFDYKEWNPFLDDPNTLSRRELDIIFEPGQGILLDQNYGFFPHVTRSSTISDAAAPFLSNIRQYEGDIPRVHWVHRAYSTRHGTGPFPGEEFSSSLSLIKPEIEHNGTHKWQGELREAPLNLDMVNHAMNVDSHTRTFEAYTELHINCCDRIEGDELPVIINGKLKGLAKDELPSHFSQKYKQVLMNLGNLQTNLYYNEKS